MMHRLRSSLAATNRNLRSAEVIDIDAARATRRRQALGPRVTQATILETRERTSNKFFLQDEPLLRFRDFDARP